MKEIIKNSKVKFLIGYILSNIFWILPLQFFLLFRSPFLSFAFFCFVVSHTYWQFKKYLAPPKLKLYHTNPLIEWGYNISIWGFLLVTGYSVFWGLMNNYVTNSKIEWVFVLGYTISLCVLLITITYMIKTGKNWVLLCLAYLVFDLPGAMPFNFLFFYENKKIQSRLDDDKKLVPKLISDSRNLFSPIMKSSDSIYNDLVKKNDAELLEAQRKFIAVNQFILENNKSEKKQDKLKKPNYGRKKIELEAKFKAINEINKGIDRILSNIDTACKNYFGSNKIDREKQILMMADVKINLEKVILAINDSALKSHLNELLPNEPTQTESIKALYGYIYSIFSKGRINKAAPSKDNMTKEEIALLAFEMNKQEKEQHLIISSLIPSIIIDLMPLLFSIVYARWNNKKEAIV